MRISDWSSDVCPSDLHRLAGAGGEQAGRKQERDNAHDGILGGDARSMRDGACRGHGQASSAILASSSRKPPDCRCHSCAYRPPRRSEEHTSELQSLMRISYAVFCLKKQNPQNYTTITQKTTNLNKTKK